MAVNFKKIFIKNFNEIIFNVKNTYCIYGLGPASIFFLEDLINTDIHYMYLKMENHLISLYLVPLIRFMDQ